jgi:hypothetical protein
MPLGAMKRLACYSDVWTTFQRERLWFKERERGLHRKRTVVEPRKGDKRYVRRKKGRFTTEQDDVGRSLSQDRRRRAKKKAPKGQGDRGDAEKPHSSGRT